MSCSFLGVLPYYASYKVTCSPMETNGSLLENFFCLFKGIQVNHSTCSYAIDLISINLKKKLQATFYKIIGSHFKTLLMHYIQKGRIFKSVPSLVTK